jgi:hypothetical protein
MARRIFDPEIGDTMTANRLNSVIVKVTDLIEIVQANRDTHQATYEDALAGFRLAANHALNDRIDAIASRKVVDLQFAMPVPVDHTEDYDRVLTMLKLTKDDWGWKGAFEQTSTFYSASAS